MSAANSEILRRLAALEQASAQVRQGVVAALNPLTVYVGNSTVAVPAMSVRSDVPTVGDRVSLVQWRGDILVLGGPTGAGGYVTSLPSSPPNGTEVYFAADAANGVIWHLRYRSAASGSYKWEYLGGPPMVVEDTDSRNLTNQTSFANLPTDPMSLTLPDLAGDFDITAESAFSAGSTGVTYGFLSYAVGGVGASDAWGVRMGAGVQYTQAVGSHTKRHTGVVRSSVIAEKAKTEGNYTFSFFNRRISVLPVRVG